MAPVYLLPFFVSSPAEKRRYVFSHAINPRVGKSLPSTQYIYTHTLSFFFLLRFGLSHGSGLQYLWTTKNALTTNKSEALSHTHTHNVHTNTQTGPFSLPPQSVKEKSPDNQIYIKWRTLCVGTNRLTSSFFTLNGSLLSKLLSLFSFEY